MKKRIAVFVALFWLPISGFDPIGTGARIQQPPPPKPPSLSKPSPQPTPPAEPKEDLDVVTVSTNLVTVPLRVRNQKGSYVSDMRAEEFHVFEDGVEQQLAYFSPVDSPFTVSLMLDVSDSTQSSLGQIKEAAIAFINQLRADDEVIIIHFDGVLNVVGQPTSDRAVLRAMIEQVPSGSGTHLYDAVDKVLTRLLTQIKGRKAVVLFTDGVDVGSRTTAKQTLREAEAGEALIYSVYYDTEEALKEKLQVANRTSPYSIRRSRTNYIDALYAAARRYLDSLAQKTGARMYPASNPEKMAVAFASIAEGLRAQYSLGYYPAKLPQAGQRRKIKIQVARPRVEVDARDSYLCRSPIASTNK
jgi:Ca-activated chloride channel homolog